jgi:hypothetical protein
MPLLFGCGLDSLLMLFQCFRQFQRYFWT